MEQDLTKGGILGKMILFSLPMILGNVLQQIYSIVDMLIVGKFIGVSALAAVGSTFTLMTFITSIIIGLCMGSGALYSISYGEQNRKKLIKEVWMSFYFITMITIVIYAIVYPFCDEILHVLQIPDTVYPLMKGYVLIVYLGIAFIFLYNFFAFVLRAVGNSIAPLVFLGISSGINIVLDVYFVLVLHMGVEGTAIATVISQIIAGLGIAIYAFLCIPWLKPKKEDLKYDQSTMREVITNDVPTCLQQSVMNFGILMIQGLVNSFGEVIMAAFAAVTKIDTLAYMPSQEFGNAYSLFLSQNYGAKKYDRIKKGTKMAFLVSIGICAIISIFVNIYAVPFMEVFVEHSETAIIAEGVRYLRIEGSTYIGIGALFLFYGYFRGVKQPFMSLILTIVSLGTRVVFAYTFAPHTPLGVIAIWLAIPIGWALADTVGLISVRRDFQKHKN